MEANREFGELAAILPADELSIGLHHFHDASVRRPSPSEPAGKYLAEAIQDAETLRVLTWLAPP